jgi:hypothetical protein
MLGLTRGDSLKCHKSTFLTFYGLVIFSPFDRFRQIGPPHVERGSVARSFSSDGDSRADPPPTKRRQKSSFSMSGRSLAERGSPAFVLLEGSRRQLFVDAQAGKALSRTRAAIRVFCFVSWPSLEF